jgi:predicted small lipoprotein YifL
MKNKIKYTMFFVVLVSLVACGQTDKLVPLYNPVTVSQLTNNKPTKFTYQVDDTQIDEYGKIPGKFPVFGRFFKAIAKAMANATIGKDGVEMDLPTTVVDMSSLLKVDFETIDVISLDQLDIMVRDSKSKDTLKFLDKIEIYGKLKHPIDGLPVDENGFTRLLYYDRVDKSLGCNDKCLILKTEEVNWKKFLIDNPVLEIKPIIFVNSVPESTMKLAGSIQFSIKFNVGF